MCKCTSINYNSIVYHLWLLKPVDYDCWFNSLAITFIFGNGYIYEKTTRRYTDVFINCSSDPVDAAKSWDFENVQIYSNDKYKQNISGLTILNVTGEDQGHYICSLGNVDSINATILLNVICK